MEKPGEFERVCLTECLARGKGWTMVFPPGKCVQQQELPGRKPFEPNNVNDIAADATQRFFAYASGPSCSLFRSDAQQCVNRVVTGTVYFRAPQNIVDNDKGAPRTDNPTQSHAATASNPLADLGISKTQSVRTQTPDLWDGQWEARDGVFLCEDVGG